MPSVSRRPGVRYLGHEPEYKAERVRLFLRAAVSNDSRAAGQIVQDARDETPTSHARSERCRKIAAESGWTWRQGRVLTRGAAALDAADYLRAKFLGEAPEDANVRLLEDFIPVVKAKQAIGLAPRNVEMVAEAMLPARYPDDDDARIPAQAMADALGVTTRTLRNWTDWYRQQRFSTWPHT